MVISLANSNISRGQKLISARAAKATTNSQNVLKVCSPPRRFLDRRCEGIAKSPEDHVLEQCSSKVHASERQVRPNLGKRWAVVLGLPGLVIVGVGRGRRPHLLAASRRCVGERERGGASPSIVHTRRILLGVSWEHLSRGRCGGGHSRITFGCCEAASAALRECFFVGRS